MTAQQDPYVRVYYRALSDQKFKGLSLSAWGLWLKLLVVADGLHPASAPLPRWTEDGPLSELVSAHIIDMDGEDFYTVHGLMGERQRRSDAAAESGKARAENARRDASGRFAPSSDGPATPAVAGGSPAGAGDGPPVAGDAGGVRAHEPAVAGTVTSDGPARSSSPLLSTPSRASPLLSDPSPLTPPSGAHVDPRANGTNPRAMGTNPRAVADREREGRRERVMIRHQAYLRGEIDETTFRRLGERDELPTALPADQSPTP